MSQEEYIILNNRSILQHYITLHKRGALHYTRWVYFITQEEYITLHNRSKYITQGGHILLYKRSTLHHTRAMSCCHTVPQENRGAAMN